MKSFFSSALVFILATHCHAVTAFYIAPDGNDRNPGTQQQPFASLVRAREAVRKINRTMTSDIVIYLSGGRYTLSEAIEFGPKDSGFNGNKIIYKALDDENPTISGGVRVTGWELYNRGKNIYRAHLPDILFRQVYLQNQLSVRARTPNRESESSFGPYWRLTVPRLPECNIPKKEWQAVAGVEQLGQVELVTITHWYHQRIRIGETRLTDSSMVILPLNPEGKMSKKLYFYKTSYYYFENAFQFVDIADEWYYDPEESFLYYAFNESVHPDSLIFEVPVIPTLVAIRGTEENPVHNLEFQGITFECSNWISPSEKGLNATQFAQPIGSDRHWHSSTYPSGLIKVAHAHNIAFRYNTIRNAGAQGIQFFMNVDDADIEGNQIYNIAANAIEVDAHALKNPSPQQQSTGVAIWNNHIYKAGQNYSNGGGVLAHNVRGLIVEHNHIHDMPYSGMQVGNQPGEIRDIGCGENRIRYNHVHHCMQLHDDGGGIYTLGGIQQGTFIAENYLHDIKAGKWAGSYAIDFIYLDNFSSQILVKDNVVAGGKAAERNGAAGNTLINNIQSNPAIEKNAGIKAGYTPR